MPLDPMIAGGIQPIQTGVMSPLQGLQLRQLALGHQMTQADFADQQLARENRVKLRDVFNSPGAFDPKTGAPTPETIQRLGAISPEFAMGAAREGHLTRQMAVREENLQQLHDYREAQEKVLQQREEKLRIANMHEISREFTTAALARHQGLVDQGAAPDVAGQGFRDAWLDEIDQREKSGALKQAGYTDAEIAQLKANVPTPDQAKQAMETSREREIRKKAELDNPIQQTRLKQTDRRLDQADVRLNQADIKAQTRNGGQTAAGVKLEKAPAGYRYVDGGSALEPIPGGPADKGNTGGTTAGKEQYMKPPAGYQWEEGGKRLTPIPGGPADKPKVGGSPTLSGVTQEKPYLRGEEFLATLTPEYADRIRAIAKGNFNISDFAKSRKDQAQIADDVLQFKGDYTKPPPRSAAGGGPLTLTKAGIHFAADRSLNGDFRATAGLSKADRAAVLSEAASMAQAQGINGKEFVARMSEVFGQNAAQRAIGTRAGGVELGIETVKEIGPLVLQASDELKRTNVKSVNDLYEAALSRTASPQLRALKGAINGFVNTYARTIGGGQVHVADQEHAREILDAGFSHGDIISAVKTLTNEMEAEQRAVPKAQKRLHSNFTGKEEAPPKRETPQSPMPTKAQAAPPANAPLTEAEQQRLKYLREKHGR
jgi:hypothetical protein